MTSPGNTIPGNTVLVIAHEWDAMAGQVVDTLAANAFDVVACAPSALCGGAVTYLSVDGLSVDDLSADGTTMWASTVPQTSVGAERTISSTEVGAVLNRAIHLDPTGFADEDDESYAGCERAALFAAMVEALDCPVMNRAQGTTLSGPPRLEAEWMATAVRGGIAVRAMSWTSDGVELEPMRHTVGSVTVIGDAVLPDQPVGAAAEWVAASGDRATTLAAALRCELLRLELGETAAGRCVVTQLDPRPASLEPSIVFEIARHLAAGLTPSTVAQRRGRSDLEYAS